MKNKLLKIFVNTTIICVLLILSMSSISLAQRNYLFENISIPEGLSNSTVNYIFQDSNGFLWISTVDGLNRYDGNGIKVFKNDPNDSTSIPSNNCFAMAEDSDGFIWIGVSGNAIAKYNPIDETFQRFPIETRRINNISEFYTAIFDSKENLWFGSTNHGIQKFNRSKNRFEQVNLDPSNTNSKWGQIYQIVELKNGNILVADYGNGIKIYNKKLNVFLPYYLKTNYSPVGVSTIFEDISGNIWFGRYNTLIKYSPVYYSMEDFKLFDVYDHGGDVESIIQDDEGILWVGAYDAGLFKFDIRTNHIQNINYINEKFSNARHIIWKVYKDKFGVVWIGTYGDGLIKFDPFRKPFNYSKVKPNEVTNSGANNVTAISGSREGKKLTVGTSSKGLFSFDIENQISTPLKINFEPSTITGGNINIQSLVVDENGNIWFAYNGLGLFKLDKNNVLSQIHSFNENNSNDRNIYSLKIDLSGNLWIASGNGFWEYNSIKNELMPIPSIMNKKMSENLNQKIHEITAQRKPISSILKVGEASNLEKNFSLSSDQKVLIICVGEGRMTQGIEGVFDKGSLLSGDGKVIWSMSDLLKTFNDGGGFKNRIAVKCLDLKKGEYKINFSTDVGHSYGNWNVVPPHDSIWYGIQVLNINNTEFNSIEDLSQREINSDKYLPMEIGTSIEFSKKMYNVVWLGSSANSFFKYDISTGNFKQYNFDSKNKFSPDNSINTIFEDRMGILWVATASNLIRFDPEKENIEKFNQKDGLPSNLVNTIVEDMQGNLWINTSSGLSKLNKNAPRDEWNFVNFDARDGLQGLGASKASWISKNGEIVLGGNDGLISFYPGKINEVKPDVVLEDIKISDISLKSDSAAVKLKKSVMKLDELDLSYNQNNISFEFASIHFSRPGKNKIMYKLEGFNDHWIASDRNFVSFTNLNPGEYTFRLKGSNGDGIWNDEGKSIRIIINPPWWETTFAYIGYFFLFVGLVFGIDRFQRKRLIEKERALAKEKELEQAKEIEKAYKELKSTQAQLIQSEKMASLGELTAGIAHEIKNPLNFVNNFSEVSNDLISEMVQEADKGNLDEVKDIASNIKQNLEKILQHGKRADSIVKGMLLHSRGTSGEKSLTDINELLEQYVNLAYHGMRAQDKDFNIKIEKDYDKNLEKINVVPQDISRVFLNIINNACYAANNRKKKSGENNFSPSLKVSTKMLDGKVEIRIGDNGNGIPKNILDKIFQPFFTTKPTGEGTGLGLSLSYDIVTKVHGGALKVETKEGEGTEFAIVLPK